MWCYHYKYWKCTAITYFRQAYFAFYDIWCYHYKYRNCTATQTATLYVLSVAITRIFIHKCNNNEDISATFSNINLLCFGWNMTTSWKILEVVIIMVQSSLSKMLHISEYSSNYIWSHSQNYYQILFVMRLLFT